MDNSKLSLLTVNSIHIALDSSKYRVVPAVADAVHQVQSIPDMAAQHPNLLAGINGGYFWRVDVDGYWRDNVCHGKTRLEAEHPASSKNVNYGVGDGLVKIDGKVYSNNCNCTGNSRPAVLKLDGSHSSIEVLHRGESVHSSVINAIAAGPNLVSYDTDADVGYVDIPADDDNINRVVYEANSAVGLVQRANVAEQLIMVTTDGSDSCKLTDTYCGLVSPHLASLMLEVFKCTQAMSMDQGGSTTLWIKNENPTRNGVISRSDNKQPAEQESPRAVANGLFVELLV